jgi:hypothetical protein
VANKDARPQRGVFCFCGKEWFDPQVAGPFTYIQFGPAKGQLAFADRACGWRSVNLQQFLHSKGAAHGGN